MSDGSDALERAVSEFIEARAALDREAGARARAGADRAFARLAALLAPRVRHFTRRYGLADAAEDAQQVCAIAIHRAAGRYDPARACFSTYVTWQIRAEMQALRQRLRGRDARAATLSLDALVEAGADAWLVDAEAEGAAEAAASNRLAHRCADRLIGDWAARRRARLVRHSARPPVDTRLEVEAALIRRQLVDTDSVIQRLSESERHLVRRALADIAQRVAA